MQERAGSPTFPILVELCDPNRCIVHWVKGSMDSILRGKSLSIQMREKISDDVTCSSMRHYHDAVSSTPSEESLLVDNLACMNNQNAKKCKVESSSVSYRVTE